MSSAKRTDVPPQLPLAQFQPHQAQTHVFNFEFPATVAGVNAALQGPWCPVPPGATITLRPLTKGEPNPVPVTVGRSPEHLSGAGCFYVPYGADVNVPFAVDNLNELWFAATGDSGATGNVGLSIMVQIPAVG